MCCGSIWHWMPYNNAMSDYRPDPDRLLAAVQKDEARQQRGKLKIFIGMAAGVGKTYAMLDAAKIVGYAPHCTCRTSPNP